MPSESASQPSPPKGIKTLLGAILAIIGASIGFGVGWPLGGEDSAPTSSAATSTSPSAVASAGTTSRAAAVTDGDTCAVGTLPTEATETIEDILAGGPYDYPENDNRRFGNYEGHLPQESRNFYREYTVETPGLRHRGERRIVTGGGTETDPEVWYYTDDHYESFCEIPDAE
ncbi:ribonuclease [Corynebacterium sp. 153RC1]|uniref:ribonuclease domain-containing protein n=1 Tax=unclassified Corynebacterium TaxID=2624378 RepID=UPI00211CF5D8|nr:MULTISPECIES: ribonuclease domain-containing protein [unclassified Corynebacterium]MCQ9370660.1 ribonuclease [Corynebacterium sp. 35RC1]MCQ9352342.1 ribonuclease [Corynebacterium sp. 209RC1]MCQ9354268.1 ribonuclease [Corynebacterium sp. 1222RC1]MCQ9356550.1 ribonuclease [Corynebacterium sp. 122RC1]MCQ9358866.1 ribonuclease [Corynebacterium sp. 142RC1]